MIVLEKELKEIEEKLERISSRCYMEDVDITEIMDRLDYVIDDLHNLIEFVKKLP